MKIALHRGQRMIAACPKKIVTAVMGRRFGKSRLGLNKLLMASLGFPGKVDPVSPQAVLGALPTLKQARPILWQPLVSLLENEPELKALNPKIDRTNYAIHWPHGAPSIYIRGANDKDGDGLRGLRLYFFLGDEFQDMKPGIFDGVIYPAMTDTPGSRALLTGTPKGRLNHLYEFYQRGELYPEDYGSFNLPTWYNPTIPREEIERARLILPPREFRQEYEATFESYPGQIYYELSEDKNIRPRPEGFRATFMGLDWGDCHPAVVVWGQTANGGWHFIEGWRGNTGNPIPDPVFYGAVLRLAQAHKVQGVFCDPSRPSAILAMRDMGKARDQPGLARAVAGYNRIEEGLSQVHSLIYRGLLTMDDQEAPDGSPQVLGRDLYLQLEAYRRATDRNGNVTERVEEGQDDHVADASRYCLARDMKGLLG